MNEPKRTNDQAPVAGAARQPAAGVPGRPEFEVKLRLKNPMKPQRVYPVLVQLQEYPRGRAFTEVSDVPVQVRLSIPGAQVTPAEARLDPSEPGAQATFFVTPLARGALTKAHAEVLQAGRVLQEIPLSIKGSTQCLTWSLATLTVLVPLFLVLFCRYYPLHKEFRMERINPPAGSLGGPPPRAPGAQGPQEELKPPPNVNQGVNQTHRMGLPGESLTRYIVENVYPIPGFTEPVADWLGVSYESVCNLTKSDNLAFWAGLTLLGLTLVSWLAHAPLPARRAGKPLTLAPVSGEVFSAKTLPLGGAEQPVMIEPVGD